MKVTVPSLRRAQLYANCKSNEVLPLQANQQASHRCSIVGQIVRSLHDYKNSADEKRNAMQMRVTFLYEDGKQTN